jgi:hypothetical protein
MILPEGIGNGKTHDDDDDTADYETRGASLYLEEATEVSYSGDEPSRKEQRRSNKLRQRHHHKGIAPIITCIQE